MNEIITPEFRSEAVSEATGIPMTSIEAVVRAGLSPIAKSVGRGSARRYSSQGLAHWAVTGALCKAGAPPLVAAKISRSFVDQYPEQHSYRGYLNDGLDSLWHHALNEGYQIALPSPTTPDSPADRYSFHLAINNGYPYYKPEVPTKSDLILFIADQKYLFWSTNGKLGILTDAGSFSQVASFRIFGWERGSSAIKLISVDEESQGDPEAAKFIELEFQHGLDNAIGVSRVNVSLAIRQAFKAVSVFNEKWRQCISQSRTQIGEV